MIYSRNEVIKHFPATFTPKNGMTAGEPVKNIYPGFSQRNIGDNMQSLKSLPLFGVILVMYMAVTAYFQYSLQSSFPMEIPLITLKLPSKELWVLYLRDGFVLIGLFTLFIEILKSTSSSNKQVVEHILSTFVFIFYMIAFLMAPMAANSTFFILCMMSLIDVIAGFSITITAARRDLSVG